MINHILFSIGKVIDGLLVMRKIEVSYFIGLFIKQILTGCPSTCLHLNPIRCEVKKNVSEELHVILFGSKCGKEEIHLKNE